MKIHDSHDSCEKKSSLFYCPFVYGLSAYFQSDSIEVQVNFQINYWSSIAILWNLCTNQIFFTVFISSVALFKHRMKKRFLPEKTEFYSLLYLFILFFYYIYLCFQDFKHLYIYFLTLLNTLMWMSLLKGRSLISIVWWYQLCEGRIARTVKGCLFILFISYYIIIFINYLYYL